jgi:putative nucleotidyltransferase with HDIG domain
LNDELRAAGPSAPACGACGASLANSLWIESDGGPLCERCFLARHRAPEELVPLSVAAGALAEALAAALDLREHETGLHSKRVACHTLVLARRIVTDPAHLHQVYWGALLHDIGKIGVPDAILLKHGALTAEERQVMQAHPESGYRIVSQVEGLAEAAAIVYSHEERYDGTGYPRRLAGDAIPLGARLFAVIDTLDAMTSDRPYRRALPFDDARAEIVRMSGSQFDPLAVRAFLSEEPTLREMARLKITVPTAILPDTGNP